MGAEQRITWSDGTASLIQSLVVHMHPNNLPTTHTGVKDNSHPGERYMLTCYNYCNIILNLSTSHFANSHLVNVDKMGVDNVKWENLMGIYQNKPFTWPKTGRLQFTYRVGVSNQRNGKSNGVTL